MIESVTASKSAPPNSLKVRSHQSEIMDSGDFDKEEYRSTLEQLEMINRLTMGHAPTVAAVAKLAKARTRQKSAVKPAPLRILDIGFGGGDTLRALAAWGRREQIPLELTGVDLNPWAKEVAESQTDAGDQIKYIAANIFDLPPTETYDIVINALFMHHLNDEEIVQMLKWMRTRSQLGWFINDLHRHWVAFHFIRHATRVVGANRLICNDAPLSVARSFQKPDWLKFLDRAGVPLSQIEIKWHWSFRYGVLWSPHVN
jgi:2-polyprenyl-3-methyl-5-hydroxy-6-metoxy-1,4-benzoquinol methylase